MTYLPHVICTEMVNVLTGRTRRSKTPDVGPDSVEVVVGVRTRESLVGST